MMRVLYDEEVIQKNYMKEVQERSEKIGEERGRKIGEERGKKIGEEYGKKIGEEYGRKQGAKGIVDLSKEFGLSDDEIVSRLQQKLEIPEEEAKKYLEMFGNRKGSGGN